MCILELPHSVGICLVRSGTDIAAVPALHHEGTLWRSFTNACIIVVATWHQAELV